MKTLYSDLRTEQNLFSAWRHVKKRALNSTNPKIRGEASAFEHQHQTHLKRIADQLRYNRFKFSQVTGVLKDARKRQKLGKRPRPIAIATVTDRVVQRAILQVLQPRIVENLKHIDAKYQPTYDERIGKLNEVNRSKFGVGGLMRPYGGIAPAITLVNNAISDGARYYYKSDIKGFFENIPTRNVVETVLRETKDELLVNLFANGLKVELENKESLGHNANLFPSNGRGVAQGSSLSTFAGNVLLYDFDHQLNTMGVTAVRYVDDLLIVSKSEHDLERAINFSRNYLSSLCLSLYDAAASPEKAGRGKCKNGFDFLGCTIQINRCVPSKAAIDKTINAINREISASKKAIKSFINDGKPLDLKMSRSAVLHSIGKKIYSWEKAYSFSTDGQAFKRMDRDLQKIIHDYEMCIRRHITNRSPATILTVLGIPATIALFERDNAKRQEIS